MAAWVPYVVMGAMSLAQGLFGSSTAKANADATRAWGAYNAAMAIRASEFNASAIEKIAALNSAAVLGVADIDIALNTALTEYNATLRVQTAEYNAQLLEKEAALVWEAQELDQVLLERQAEILYKDTRAAYASSGVEINVGSPVEYLVDQATQIKLESFVIRHNADIQMGKLLDAAALGRWQGEAEAAAMIYEGQLENLSTKFQSGITSNQINVQAAYDAVVERFSGQLRASQILQDSEWKASLYSMQGTQSLLTGLFQGASWAAKGYEYNYSTTTSTTSTNTTA